MLGDAVGQRVQLVLVGHVELDDRCGLGQPLRDPLHETHAAEPGEHDLRALFLGDLGGVEGQRGVGDHSGDQQPLAVEQSHGVPSVAEE